MTRRMPIVSMVMLIATVAATLVYGKGDGGKPDILVSAEWLNKNLGDPSLVILHIAFAKSEYEAGHIPGARLVSWQSIVTQPRTGSEGLTSELPPLTQLDSVMESAGVSDNSTVVIYGSLISAARLFWTIEQLGFTGRLSVLDGGLDAWREDKRPITTSVPVVARGSLTLRPRNDVVVDAEWVNSHLRAPMTRVVDARLPQFYVGADSGGMARAGHLPGAVNLPYTTLTKELSKYRDMITVKRLFEDAGVKQGEQVVAYCHVGQTASVVYFAARLMGYDARIYDGSFQDWAKRSELPLENPMPPTLR